VTRGRLWATQQGVIACQPPQPQPSDRTADSVAPGAAPTLTVAAEPQQPKGFLEWCRDAAAPAEVRHTVTVLIAYLETDDCTTAARSLATEDRLVSPELPSQLRLPIGHHIHTVAGCEAPQVRTS